MPAQFLGAIHKLLQADGHPGWEAFSARLQTEMMVHAKDLIHDLSGAGERLWTSTLTNDGNEEFCSVLNRAFRYSFETYEQDSKRAAYAAVLARAINSNLVFERKAGNNIYPFPPNGQCFRG